MNYTKTELAELVCTRISHDLIGNIGAISSALELIDGSNGMIDEETHKILETGTNTLKARQKFFRIAFGINSQTISSEQIKSLSEAYLATVGSRGNPISLDLKNSSAELAKIIFLSVMCAAEVFIKGGQIKIEMNSKNMTIYSISDYKLSETKIADYKNIVADKKVDNASQYIQLIYLRELLGKDVPMAIEHNENEMKIVVG